MTKQPEYNSLIDWEQRQRERSHVLNMDSQKEFSSESDYDEFANEIPFVSNILRPFQFEPVFTAAEIQAKKT